jgi:hypothetical protein
MSSGERIEREELMKKFVYDRDKNILLDYIAGITEEMKGYDGEEALEEYTTNFFGKDVEFDFDEGASKKVIIFHSLGFVLKFDNCGDSEREVDLYNAAVDLGLKDCFPETRLVCYHNDCEWTYQEIAHCLFEFDRKTITQKTQSIIVNEECLEIISNIISDIPHCSRTDCMDYRWLKLATHYFGYTFMGKLARFIQTNRINDLHRGNIGFINDRPVLIDFCGYHWENDYYYDSDEN